MVKFISVFVYTYIIFYPRKCISCDRGEQKKAVWDDTTYPTKYAHTFVSRFFLLALSYSWKIHSTDAFIKLGLHLDSRMIECDGYSSYVRYLIMNIWTTISASVMRNQINTLRRIASHWNGIMRRRVKCFLEILNKYAGSNFSGFSYMENMTSHYLSIYQSRIYSLGRRCPCIWRKTGYKIIDQCVMIYAWSNLWMVRCF